MSINPDENQPQDDGELVHDEDHDDIDLSDLAPKPETLRERLERAKARGSQQQPAQREGNWHDTPVNVTPSGRHEIIEEDDDEIDADEAGMDLGEDTQPRMTASGRHEVIDDTDADLGDFDDEVAGSGTIDARGGLGDAGDLDESTLGDTEPSGKIGLADDDDDGEDSENEASQRDDTELPSIRVSDILPRKETGRVNAQPSGPMTMASMEMAAQGQAADTPSGSPEEAVAEIEIPGASVPEVDDYAPSSGPMTMAVEQMLAESDIAQDEAAFGAGGESPAGRVHEKATGAETPVLLDNSTNRSDLIVESANVPTVEVAVGQALSTESEPDSLVESESGTASDAVEAVGAAAVEAVEADVVASDSQSNTESPFPAGTVQQDSPEFENDPGDDGQDAKGGTVEMVSTQTARAGPEQDHSQQSEDFLVSDESGAPLGRGLDVGTANLVAARMDEEGGIEFFPARNAFLDVPEDPYTLKMLKGQGVPYIKRENKLFIIGEDAFELANIFNREMRRPMKNGLISPTDADAMPMEVELFKKILGPPRADGEVVYYSIPADPVDSTMNIVYHTNIANGLLERLGYRGHPFNEGQAIVFSELGDDEFTGIGISCGGGMVNVCVAFRSMPVVAFSTAKGGDWIDQQAAQVMGCAASKITAIKERGVDINAPKTPEEEAIVIYYRHLIKYSLENIIKKFQMTKDIPNFPKPVPIAISGGTSKVGGFVEVFKDEFSRMSGKFPIKISDIRKAEDQLNATAKGCLLAALSHEE